MIQLYYSDKAEERGIKGAVAGGVTFVQRFGSALNSTSMSTSTRSLSTATTASDW